MLIIVKASDNCETNFLDGEMERNEELVMENERTGETKMERQKKRFKCKMRVRWSTEEEWGEHQRMMVGLIEKEKTEK